MNHNYAVDYRPYELRRGREFTRSDHDAEVMVMQLLTAGARITAIRCDGVAISVPQFDRLLKASADRVAAGMLGTSLALDSLQVHDRFGYAA
jgi:hypothetical protein